MPQLLAALDKEQGEFVRPALVRALAAHGDDPRVRQALLREVGARRGLLPQRRHRGARRLQGARTRSTRSPRSPSSTGRCRTMRRWRSGRSATSARSRRWPRCSGPRRKPTQPSIAAAICLLGVNCSVAPEAISPTTLKFADENPGFQELLRGAAAGLGALARRGPRRSGGSRCSTSASRRDDPTRAPVALALATVALRNTPLMLTLLEKHADQSERDRARSPKASTCSKRISRRSGSSPPSAAPTGQSPDGSPRRALMQSADRQAGLLMPTADATTKHPASTSTPATRPSAASSRSRGRRSRPACSPRSARSAGCSASTASAIRSRCSCRAPTASAPS